MERQACSFPYNLAGYAAICVVPCDGQEFTNRSLTGEDRIELHTVIGDHDLRIHTGYQPGAPNPDRQRRDRRHQPMAPRHRHRSARPRRQAP